MIRALGQADPGPANVGPDISLRNRLRPKARHPNHLPPHYPRLGNGASPLHPGPLRHGYLSQSSRTPGRDSLWWFSGFGPRARGLTPPEDSEIVSLLYMPVFHVIEPRPAWS
jgi:hypothetical protein